MNQKNLADVKRDLYFTGFGEKLYGEVEQKMKEGKPEFTVFASEEYGGDKMEAVLHFKKSKDNYYFNSYDATLKHAEGDRMKTIKIHSLGQSVTLKECCNQLNGRAIHKEFAKTPEEGQQIKSADDIQTYRTWLQLDLTKKDGNEQYVENRYHEKYGFEMVKELNKLNLKEMANSRSAGIIENSLRKGDPVTGTLVKDGNEIRVAVVTDPANRVVIGKDDAGNLTLSTDKKKDLIQKNEVGSGLIEKNNRNRSQKNSVGVS